MNRGNAGDSSTAECFFPTNPGYSGGLAVEIPSFPAVTFAPDRLICVVHVALQGCSSSDMGAPQSDARFASLSNS